jgi:hypothetical protein
MTKLESLIEKEMGRREKDGGVGPDGIGSGPERPRDERRETLAWRLCPSGQIVALSPAPMRISSVVVIRGQAWTACWRGWP